MALLFEYGNWESIRNKDALKLMLQNIWQQLRSINTDLDIEEAENDNRYQPFLQFDNSLVKANNFVGFIQNECEIIEIYPKVFRNEADASHKKALMLQHIFYWFSYCRRWAFPFNIVSLDTQEIDEFPELIINLFASQFLETVSRQPLTMYQPSEDVFQTPKGSINFKRYINNNFTHGNYQNLDCDYEPFLFDNSVNRIIKYCTRILLNQTRFHENQRILQELIFILDEVEDLPFSFHDLERVSINPFFEDYSMVMSNCSLILSQKLYSNNSYDLSQWFMLFPMEYIFEDFFAGFLESRFQKHWQVKYQKSDMFLAVNEYGKNVFNMQHDIFLISKEYPELKIIVDTKYKLRDKKFKDDLKKGVAQNDLYQMVSYAFRRGCTNLIIVYPNLSDTLNPPDTFEIVSGFETHVKLNVTALEIPFWSFSDFGNLEIRLEQVITELLLHSINMHISSSSILN